MCVCVCVCVCAIMYNLFVLNLNHCDSISEDNQG